MENINIGKKETAIGVGVVCIFILFCRFIEDSFIEGFWKADADFCAQAEIINYVVYFGPGIFTRNCYFIAMNNAGLFLNHPVDMNFGFSFNFKPWISHCVERRVSLSFITEEPDEDVLPASFIISYYPTVQKMVLHDGDTVLAVLYKDAVLSASIKDTMPKELIESSDEE